MVNLITELGKTPEANKRFVAYYKKSNFQLTIPIADFFKSEFRYQYGVFLDYLHKENLGISVYHKGFIIYILDAERLQKDIANNDMFFESIQEDSFHVLVSVEYKPEPHYTIDIVYQECAKAAIILAFDYIHNAKNGYNKNFNPL